MPVTSSSIPQGKTYPTRAPPCLRTAPITSLSTHSCWCFCSPACSRTKHLPSRSSPFLLFPQSYNKRHEVRKKKKKNLHRKAQRLPFPLEPARLEHTQPSPGLGQAARRSCSLLLLVTLVLQLTQRLSARLGLLPNAFQIKAGCQGDS